MMKHSILLLIFLSTAIISAHAQSENIRWYDYEEGILTASATQKPAILDFYADWCGPCIAMEQGTYPDPRVISELKDFIAIKVDTQKRIDIESKYGIAYYPTVVFIDSKGKEVSRHIGYLEPEEMVKEIKESRGKLPREVPGFEAILVLLAFAYIILLKKVSFSN